MVLPNPWRFRVIAAVFALGLVAALAHDKGPDPARRNSSARRSPVAGMKISFPESPSIRCETTDCDLEAEGPAAGWAPMFAAVPGADERTRARAEALATLRVDPDPHARCIAVFTLWNLQCVDDEAAVAILHAVRAAPRDEELMAQALYALRESARPEVRAFTLASLASGSTSVRKSAIQALRFRDGEDVTRSIAERVQVEPDPDARRWAVLALGIRAHLDRGAQEALAAIATSVGDAPTRELAGELLRDLEGMGCSLR